MESRCSGFIRSVTLLLPNKEEARASVHPSVHEVPPTSPLWAVRAEEAALQPMLWTPGLQLTSLPPAKCLTLLSFPHLPGPPSSHPPGCRLLTEPSLWRRWVPTDRLHLQSFGPSPWPSADEPPLDTPTTRHCPAQWPPLSTGPSPTFSLEGLAL